MSHMSNENHDPNIPLTDITNISWSSQTTQPTRRRVRPHLSDRVVRLNNTEVTQPLQLSPQQVLPQSPLNSRYNGNHSLTPSTTIPSQITSSLLKQSVANTHVTTPPLRRPSRPPLQPNVVPARRNVRPRLTRNDDHINMSTHLTLYVMLSSVTVVDTDGNPVQHTQLRIKSNPSCPTTNVVHSLYDLTSTCDMSTSATNQQSDTNVPMSIHRMACQNRRIIEYFDFVDATYTCSHCQAKYWYGERTVRRSPKSNPKFSTCCSKGKVQFPFLHDAPQLLQQLMDYNGRELSKLFPKK
ncbi:hypothetical protein Tco_0639788 [Tanacetum coccineum]